MMITLTPDLEAALNDTARKQGIAPEILALNVLRERFVGPAQRIQPRDEWERCLLEAATDCGVALSHEAVSSEGLYEYWPICSIPVSSLGSPTADPFHAVAAHAVLELRRAGEVLHLTAQNLVEFRNLATRPKAVNGLGLSAVDAEAKAAVFEGTFPLLAETPHIYPTWKSLVGALGDIGRRVHDARLVAICHVQAVTHVLVQRLAFRGHGGIWAGYCGGRPGERVRQ